MDLDADKIKALILDAFRHQHRLGEDAAGSGHLSFVSVTGIELGEPKVVVHQGLGATEIPFKLRTYVETEFLHPPEDDALFTREYVGRVVLDGEMNVLDFTSSSP